MRQGVRLKNIKRVRKGGKVFCYFRNGDGSLTRLPPLSEDHPEFLTAYLDAVAKSAPASVTYPARSLAPLARSYLSSATFKRLAPTTQSTQRRIIAKITDGARGAAVVTGLRQKHVENDLSGLPPSTAQNRLKSWRALMRHAKRLGWLQIDPSADVRIGRVNHTPHRSWTKEAVAAFRATWPMGTRQRAAFEIAYNHAPRRADLAVMGPRDIVAGMISWRQSKNGLRTVQRAVHPDAAQAVAALMELRPQITTFLETDAGKARSVNAVGEWFRSACEKAGLQGLTLHGLRHTLGSDAAEGGANEQAIQHLLGHRTTGEARVYTQQAEAVKVVGGGVSAAQKSRGS